MNIIRAKKKIYRVKIDLSEAGKQYYNKFEDAHYIGDGAQMVITGTRGEQWLIKPEKVAAKYKNIGGNVYETVPSAEIVNAMVVPDGTKVTTSWGTVLTAKNSVKVWPDGKNPDSDAWLVERNIFNDTYQQIKEEKGDNKMKIGFINVHGNKMETLNKNGSFVEAIKAANPDVLIFAEADTDQDLRSGQEVSFKDVVFTVVKQETKNKAANSSSNHNDTMIFLCKPELFDKEVRRLDLMRKIRVGNFTVEGIHWASPYFKGKDEQDVFKSVDACINNHCKPDCDIKIGDFNLDRFYLDPQYKNDISKMNKKSQWEAERVSKAEGLMRKAGLQWYGANTYTYKGQIPKNLDYVWSRVPGKFDIMSQFLPGFDHKYIQFTI